MNEINEAAYFSTRSDFFLGIFTLQIVPSTYHAKEESWSNVELFIKRKSTGEIIASTSIAPGSDRVKLIVSGDMRHIAIVCESQWYEDLYLFRFPSLEEIANFEGTHLTDGASEGFFDGEFFLTLPTFSYEGGCGGLRTVNLNSGLVRQLLASEIFDGLRVWLKPAGSVRGQNFTLSTPFGLLGYNYESTSGILVLEYVPGKLIINLKNIHDEFCAFTYRFSSNELDAAFEFEGPDGNRWLLSKEDLETNWWLSKKYVRAVELLRQGTGNPKAVFRDGQEDAIRQVFQNNGRLLVVQKTGWGKSFVYFIAAKLLREQGLGTTLLISPLLSLMRNQIAAAKRMGVRAATINSDNTADWGSVIASIARREVDILLISPERLANEKFNSEVLAKISTTVSMLVIDEAHCISDWGHDFRPHYRLLERIVKGLPKNLRLLATTATANNRVMDDLKNVLGPSLMVSRGDLNRPSLNLQTLRIPSQVERLAWLAEHVASLPGNGIIYTLTIRDALMVTGWLQSRGLNVEAYTGRTGDRREELEQALLDNKVKALVATTALGMGFDKPDLAFVIHYQMPGSVVAYYQQVGRAGRALDAAYGVLLSGTEDSEITDYFIESGFPSREEVQSILQVINASRAGLSVPEILASLNINGGRVKKCIQLLSLESPAPIAKVKGSSKWQLTTANVQPSFWERAQRLTDLRRVEQRQMQRYVQLDEGHMAYLIEALDGDASAVQKPNLPALSAEIDPVLARDAVAFLRRTSLPIEPRKKWPTGGMAQFGVANSSNIPPELQAQPGKVLCVWGDAGWGKLVSVGKYRDGVFSDELVQACVKLVREWGPNPTPTWVTAVPSLRHPRLVPDFARKLAEALGLPFMKVLVKTSARPEQKTMANSVHQARNVDGSIDLVADRVPPGPVLLVDDMVDSKWTITVASCLLLKRGSGPVWPLALAQTGHETDESDSL